MTRHRAAGSSAHFPPPRLAGGPRDGAGGMLSDLGAAVGKRSSQSASKGFVLMELVARACSTVLEVGPEPCRHDKAQIDKDKPTPYDARFAAPPGGTRSRRGCRAVKGSRL